MSEQSASAFVSKLISRQQPQSQAEITRRVNYVKKVIRRVYEKHKKEYESKLQKTKKRDSINLKALTEFLKNPANRGLLNRIYEQGITPDYSLSVEALSNIIDPATIPTIFSPRVPALERVAETPAETARAEAETAERGQEVEVEVGLGLGLGEEERLRVAQERLQEALQAEQQRTIPQRGLLPPEIQRSMERVRTRAGITEAMLAIDPEGKMARQERTARQEQKEKIQKLIQQKQREKLIQQEKRRVNVPPTSSANVPAEHGYIEEEKKMEKVVDASHQTLRNLGVVGIDKK